MCTIERLAENAPNVKKHKNAKEATTTVTMTRPAAAGVRRAGTGTLMEIAAARPPATITTPDMSNEVPLPGSNTQVSANSVVKGTTTSRAPQDENHVAPTFSTGKYSASLATAFGDDF